VLIAPKWRLPCRRPGFGSAYTILGCTNRQTTGDVPIK
jgi:hypothetical protein